ncbi:LysR family transcriptional regulator [Reinekea blandensis]|uniref:Transcriptional regulator n=1 Tax=Reinekea blandensis MED297 TaxID=314283 RepID=A4BGY0_9GAMM|nr:LysR family transcriptional regulator [Reinekea blandensis]EAR08626.1 transcriptional regulator [Reinekea sp. MED297] [Reinekea blandensis MED297]
METMPNLRHLRAFCSVAQCHSISRASDQVHLSQPAITQAISKLEAELDTALFERKSDGMYLTDAGTIWLTRVNLAINYLERAVSSVQPKGSNSAQLIHQITTTQLRSLTAITRHHSFSEAGRQLNISQSSVHRSGKELELCLGVVLFLKSKQGVTPTPAAETLARASKLAFNEIQQGYHDIRALKNIDTSMLTIGSMPLPRTVLLPEVINRFTEKKPTVSIRLIEGSYDDLLHHLRYGDIDFLIGALRLPGKTADIVQHRLFDAPLALIARYDHPIFATPDVTLETLSRFPWIVPKQGTPTRSAFDRVFKDAAMEQAGKLVESTSQILIREVLLGSDRLSIISPHQIRFELDNQLLRTIPYRLPQTSRPIGYAVREGFIPTATQKAFLEELKTVASSF